MQSRASVARFPFFEGGGQETREKKSKRDLNHTDKYKKDRWGGESGKTDLLDCLETPSERDQPEEGVEVQAKLCKRSSGARQNRNEAVDACCLVKELTTLVERSDVGRIRTPLTANNSAIVTPVLRSRRPRKVDIGQSRHSGRSISFICRHIPKGRRESKRQELEEDLRRRLVAGRGAD